MEDAKFGTTWCASDLKLRKLNPTWSSFVIIVKIRKKASLKHHKSSKKFQITREAVSELGEKF
jgi:hypothetical protein